MTPVDVLPWGLYSLILTGCFSFIISFYLYYDTGLYKYLALLGASAFFTIFNLSLLLEHFFTNQRILAILNWLVQWGGICCIAFVLISLLFFSRETKLLNAPIHYFYSIVPILVILSFLIVYNSHLLRMWLFTIYETGALLISLVLSGITYYRRPVYRTIFIGTLFFLISYVLYLILPVTYKLIWRIVLAIGIIITFSGLLSVNTKFRVKKTSSANT
jgi:hypothetical protein